MEDKIETRLFGLKIDFKQLESMRSLCLEDPDIISQIDKRTTNYSTFPLNYLPEEEIIDKYEKKNEVKNFSFVVFGDCKKDNEDDCPIMKDEDEENNIQFENLKEQKTNKNPPETMDEEKKIINKSSQKSNNYKITNIEEEEKENLTNLNKSHHFLEIRIPKKIFSIKKNKKKLRRKIIKDKNRVQKNLGRKFKNSTIKSFHNKFCQDNIIRKFKSHLINNFRNYINKKFIDKSKEIVLINGYQCQNNEIEFNLKWLKTKLKEVYSAPVSNKANKNKLFNNEKLIEEIYKEKKENEVIKILNLTVEEAINNYIGIRETKNDLKKLNDDVEELREKGESQEYINQYLSVAMNFEKIYRNKVPRGKRVICSKDKK